MARTPRKGQVRRFGNGVSDLIVMGFCRLRAARSGRRTARPVRLALGLLLLAPLALVLLHSLVALGVVLPPAVTGVTPSSGAGCQATRVVLNGSNFLGADLPGGSVKFGDATLAAGSYVVDSDTQITVNATPTHTPATVDVVVTTLTGSSPVTAADHYTFAAQAASVSGLSVARGPVAGGTALTVSGSCFFGVTSVRFGSAPASSFTVVSPTQITTTSPAQAAGDLNAVDVTVVNAGGTSTPNLADQYAYVTAPTVINLTPGRAPTAGGNTVAVLGSGFFGGTGSSKVSAVRFGSQVLGTGSYTVDLDTRITITGEPANVPGTVDVTVTTDGGTSAVTPADHFTWVTAPTVTGVSPSRAPTAGGTSVTISGTGFYGGTAAANVTVVKFGALAAASYAATSDTSITAVSPVGATGSVDVTVTTDGGPSATVGADAFTYVAAPTVTSLSLTRAPTAGGSAVTIMGTGFFGGTGASNVSAVKFGASAATSYSVTSDTSITATSPAGSAGTVDVTVTTDGGSSSGAADRYTYVAAPSVSSVSPGNGTTAGGGAVTIGGTGFYGGTAAANVSAVKFGSVAATGVAVVSDSQLTAVAPAQAAGTVDVTVTTDGGASSGNAGDLFTVVTPPQPAVSGVSPTRTPTGGGTSVSITGAGYFGGIGRSNVSAVKFGTVAASQLHGEL